jgi:hypothetical protein
LFAALNVLEGGVIGRCMQRHRHQEFIRFWVGGRGFNTASERWIGRVSDRVV